MSKNLNVAVAAALFATSANAGNITATLSCSTCTDVTSLTSFVNGWAQASYPLLGTYVLVWSTAAPVSGMFKTKQTARGINVGIWQTPPGETPCTDTVSCNAQAVKLDSRIFHRAAKFPAVIVNLPVNADELDIQLSLVNQIHWTGGNGFVDLHWLGVGFPLIWYYNLSLNGAPSEPVFIGDTIVILFGQSPGYAEQYVFDGLGPSMPYAQPEFTLLPNSLTYKGKPVTPPSNVQATPMANFGEANSPTTWPPGTVQTQSDFATCSGASQLIATLNGETQTFYGFWSFPC